MDITLSLDNGLTYPIILANNTPNDGNQLVGLPLILNSNARIKIQADGNVYYDVSDAKFTITP